MYLDGLRQSGAVFNYPEALSLEEWAGLRALARARADLTRQQNEKIALQRQREEWIRKAKQGGR